MSFDFDLWWQQTQNALIIGLPIIIAILVYFGVALLIRKRRGR